jgi:hypothetical protein
VHLKANPGNTIEASGVFEVAGLPFPENVRVLDISAAKVGGCSMTLPRKGGNFHKRKAQNGI